MFPKPPMMPGQDVPGPVPMEEPEPAAAEDKQLVERQLETLLRKAKQIAEQNGINFTALVSRLERSKEGAAPTAPPMPPSAQSPFTSA